VSKRLEIARLTELKEGNKRDRAKLKSHNAKDYQALKIKHETDQKLEADLKTAKQRPPKYPSW
jgi:hypothetical protein